MTVRAREEPSDFEHRISPRVYLWVLIALLVLLVLTAVASDFDLGPFNVVVAMIIALAKAALIVTYFMHLRWSTWMVRLFAAAALFWLSILFVLSLNDYFTRAREMLPVGGGPRATEVTATKAQSRPSSTPAVRAGYPHSGWRLGALVAPGVRPTTHCVGTRPLRGYPLRSSPASVARRMGGPLP